MVFAQTPFGTAIGSFNGVTAFSNGSVGYDSGTYNSSAGINSGLEWQCVEYVNRYYYLIYSRNIRIPGQNANQYYPNASARGLANFPNGGSAPPQIGDLLCFDGGSGGHNAIIRGVSGTQVTVIQQNVREDSNDANYTYPLTVSGGTYFVDGSRLGASYYCQGWLRPPSSASPVVIRVLSQSFSFPAGAAVTIEAKLQDAQGQGIPNTTIYAEDPLIKQCGILGATAADGRFALSYVGAATANAGPGVYPVVLVAGKARTTVVINLEPPAGTLFSAETLRLNLGPVGPSDLLTPDTLVFSSKIAGSTSPVLDNSVVLDSALKLARESGAWLVQQSGQFLSDPINDAALLGLASCVPGPNPVCGAVVDVLVSRGAHQLAVSVGHTAVDATGLSAADKEAVKRLIDLTDVGVSAFTLSPDGQLVNDLDIFATAWDVSQLGPPELVRRPDGEVVGFQCVALGTTGKQTHGLVFRKLPTPSSQTFAIHTSPSAATDGATSGNGPYFSGANVTVLAAANPGYHFVNWTEGGAVVSSDAAYTFSANANRNLVANFTSAPPICPDPNEPNDSSLTATPFAFGVAANGYVCTATDVDWFGVNVTMPGVLTFDLTVPGANDYDLELFGPNAAYITGSYNTAGLTEHIACNATVTGTYYVRVYGYPAVNGSHNPSVPYSLIAGFTSQPVVATPTISPYGGSFQSSVPVTLYCATVGAAIYYTLDGGDPTTSSTLYSTPFTLTTSAQVKARSFKSGYNQSAVVSANFTVTTTPGTVPITFATSPSGLLVSVDGGTAAPAPVTVNWVPGQAHTVSTTSPQSSPDGHTRYNFSSWNDGGAQTHSLTTPSVGTTYTANFSSQYQLAITVSPPGAGNVTPTPNVSWYNPGQTVSLTASAASGYSFSSWSGVDSQSGDVAQLTMNNYRNVTASFGTRPSGAGSIRVSIVPQSAADQGAQWKLTTEASWHSSGTIVTVPALGDYVVQFKTITGWNTPGNKTITLFPAQTDVWIDSDPYTQQPVLPLYENFMSIAFGNNTFLVVGGAHSVVTTADGVSWARQPGLSDVYPQGASYANNMFVVVGSYNGGRIMTSPDGTNWTSRFTTTPYDMLSGVTFGQGLYVAVGSKPVTSPDGVNWTVRDVCPYGYGKMMGVAYGKNMFVATTEGGMVVTSSDGTTWQCQPPPGAGSFLGGIAYGQNTFVAVGWAGKLITSSDGVNWAVRASSATDLLTGITFANNQFVAVGDSGTVVTSSDGTNWVKRNLGTTQTLRGVTYGNNTFMAAGWNGTILPLGSTFSPLIVQQPVGQVAQVGQGVVFTVTADGPGAISYHWQHDGVEMGGETNWMLSLPSVTVAQAGSYAVMVNTASAQQLSQIAPLTVNTATPVITWATPADITYGTALSTAQLNATASTAGSFAYSPLLGTVLSAGNAQSLTATFTPTDTTNYAPTTTTLNINVLKASLTVAASDSTRPYGSGNPAFGGMNTGLQNNDNITATYNSSATPSTPVGNYAIVPSLQDPGNKLGNYAVTIANGTLSVTPAALTVTANDASRTYGNANPAFNATITGFVNGDTAAVVSGSASLNTAATATSPVGPYPIVPAVGTLSAANYTFDNFANGTLSVGPAGLTITANNRSKTYGQAVTFAGTEFTPSGLQNSETVGSVTLTSSGAVATAGVSGSPFSIVPSAASGGTFNSANYTISYQNGALTVNPAALTVTANDTNRVYGATNPVFTGTIVGLQNNDNITTAYNCSATASSPVGSYDIVPSLVDPDGRVGNYSVTLRNGRLAVIAAQPIISNAGAVGNEFRLSVNATAAGANYVLEYKNSVTAPAWTAAQTLPGTGGAITFTNDTGGSPARFYRIRVE